MKTYPFGCKCSGREMDLIIKERDEMLWKNSRLHSSEVNSVIRREVERYFNINHGEWHCEGWVIDTIQSDLKFTDVQIKTQLKNLCKYDGLLKRLERKPGTRHITGTSYKKGPNLRRL